MSKHVYFVRVCVLAACILSACASPPDARREEGREGEREGGARGGTLSCQAISGPLRGQLMETEQALMLTPRQKLLWDQYQESVSALMGDQLRAGSNVERFSAMRQIDARVDTVRNRLAAMEDIADRARALYQSLDEKQKQVADMRLGNTVPALYSGVPCDVSLSETSSNARPGGRGGPGGEMGRN